MIYHTSTYKLRRNTTLTKTVFEQYTRKDVPCSFSCCTSVFKYQDITNYTRQHYIIPTKEVLVTYLPLFESKYTNCIILQSVLNDIKDESKRVKEAIKKQFIFYNNFCENTYVREDNTIQDTSKMGNYNDTANNINNTNNINHINNDMNNVDISNEMNDVNITYYINNPQAYKLEDFSSISEYTKIMKTLNFYIKHVNANFIVLTPKNIQKYADLYTNKLAITDLITKSVKEKTEYAEYVKEDILQKRIKEGNVYKGTLYVNNFNCYSGIVHGEYKGRTVRIKIVGKLDMNRSMHLDTVYVEIKEDKENIVDLIENFEYESKQQDTTKYTTNINANGVENVINNKLDGGTTNDKHTDDVFGRVIGISDRKYSPIIGTVDKNTINGGGPQFVLVIPLDRKIPKIRIRTSQAEELEGKRIVVKMNGWEKDSYYPFGSYIRRIGVVGDEKSEIESILISNGIDYTNYDNEYGIESVIDCLRNKMKTNGKKETRKTDESLQDNEHVNVDDSKNVKDENYKVVLDNNSVGENNKKRKISESRLKELYDTYKDAVEYESKVRCDLRDIDVISIDPPGCTDIDDALHCRLVNGLYEVGVHIADVSYFIEMDGILDKESMNRGTTVYLTDRRIDMIPNYLSSNLCSLIENEDRLVFSVIFYFDKEYKITEKRFQKSIIRNRRSFTYEEAQNENSEHKEGIKTLNEIAKKLKKERVESGAIELSSSEMKIYTKKFKKIDETRTSEDQSTNYAKNKEENKDNIVETESTVNSSDKICIKNTNDHLPEIEKIEKKTNYETNSLIEEFMLLANVAVANKLYENLKDCSLLRRHPKFADDSFDELKEYLEKKNINLNYLSSKELNESIKNIEDGQFKEMIKKIITRSMNQAVYFSSGSVTYEEYFHYGLAMPIYTHFTSSIRRYADLVVHRQLQYIIEKEQHNKATKNMMYDNSCVENICKNINYRNRSAMYANLDCDKLFVYLYIKGRVVEEDGYIVRIRKNGIVVYVPSFGIEDTILVDYEYNEKENAFYKENIKVFGLYDTVKIRIKENDDRFFIERHFDFEIIEENEKVNKR